MENKLTSPAQNSFMANYEKTDDILKDMCGIIESSRDRAFSKTTKSVTEFLDGIKAIPSGGVA